MNFGQAFEEVKKGRGMRLPQWNSDEAIKNIKIGASMMADTIKLGY